MQGIDLAFSHELSWFVENISDRSKNSDSAWAFLRDQEIFKKRSMCRNNLAFFFSFHESGKDQRGIQKSWWNRGFPVFTPSLKIESMLDSTRIEG